MKFHLTPARETAVSTFFNALMAAVDIKAAYPSDLDSVAAGKTITNSERQSPRFLLETEKNDERIKLSLGYDEAAGEINFVLWWDGSVEVELIVLQGLFVDSPEAADLVGAFLAKVMKDDFS